MILVCTEGDKTNLGWNPHHARLPMSAEIMRKLLEVWFSPSYEDKFVAYLLWVASCMSFFDFMRSREFIATQSSESPSIGDIAMDPHRNPTMIRVFLRHGKNDPFNKGS